METDKMMESIREQLEKIEAAGRGLGLMEAYEIVNKVLSFEIDKFRDTGDPKSRYAIEVMKKALAMIENRVMGLEREKELAFTEFRIERVEFCKRRAGME